jgi:DNA-binding NtrC family response regulator
MRQIGGTLTVESEVGVGTTVMLLFPASTEVIERDVDGRTEMDNAGAEVILVVEDQDDVMSLTTMVLRDAGYRLYLARNASEALEMAQTIERIDLLFTDIIMPGGINGIALANELARDRPEMKVLLTTGFAQENPTPKQGASLRFPVLQKPTRPTKMVEAVRQTLDAPDPSTLRNFTYAAE